MNSIACLKENKAHSLTNIISSDYITLISSMKIVFNSLCRTIVPFTGDLTQELTQHAQLNFYNSRLTGDPFTFFASPEPVTIWEVTFLYSMNSEDAMDVFQTEVHPQSEPQIKKVTFGRLRHLLGTVQVHPQANAFMGDTVDPHPLWNESGTNLIAPGDLWTPSRSDMREIRHDIFAPMIFKTGHSSIGLGLEIFNRGRISPDIHWLFVEDKSK